MGSSVVCWVEAAQKIGMGHVYETMSLAKQLVLRGLEVTFVVPDYQPAIDLLKTNGLKVLVCGTDPKAFYKLLADHELKPRAVVVNHRAVEATTLSALNAQPFKVLVIDQLGDREIVSDALMNSSPVEAWQQYRFTGARAPRLLFGPAYALLRPDFAQIRIESKAETRPCANKAKSLVVCLGGVDRTGATLRVIEALFSDQNIQKNIVIGGGFPYLNELELWRTRLGERTDFVFLRNVSDMARLISTADLFISSGGNTLFEIACLGVPGLVLWEDLHEETLGKAFERLGSARVIGNGVKLPIEELRDAVLDFANSKDEREAMQKAALGLVDGKGAGRVADAIIEMVEQETA